MKTRTRFIGTCMVVVALLAAFAPPATTAPAPIQVDVRQTDLGLEIVWTCAAVAVGAATETTISTCRVEDRAFGFDTEAPSVTQDGPVAATWTEETGLQGGEDHWRLDTWVCWEASATFVGGGTGSSSGCQLVS
ncbi:MAG TPA: hypothetical protein VNP73_12250 [Actinomycetota bacterium]|nr:hypothetical protein [Actinomycetota bacterium]